MSFTRLLLQEPDRRQAAEASVAMQHLEGTEATLTFASSDGKGQIALPGPVADALRSCLKALGDKTGVILLEGGDEISPEQAGKILGISRPLVYLRMDCGLLPFRSAGSRRRLLLADVMARKPVEETQGRAARELAEDAEFYILHENSDASSMP